MNKKKLGVSVGVVSLLALTTVGLSNAEVLTKVLKNTPDNYVESISTYEEKEVKKVLENTNDDIKEPEKLESIDLEKSNIEEISKSLANISVNNVKPNTLKQDSANSTSPITKRTKTVEKAVESKESNVKVSSSEEKIEEEPEVEISSLSGWTSNDLNLRSDANTSSRVLTTIPKGTKVSGEESNGWVKVVYNDEDGYISKSYVSSTEVKVEEEKPTETKPVEQAKPSEEKPASTKPVEKIVSGWVKSNLNLRDAANTSSKVLTTIPKGTKVSGTESDGWVKVKYNGKTGYVSKSYISSTEVKVEQTKPAEEKPTETKPVEKTVSGWVKSNLNLRKSANTSSSILATIPKGTKVSGTEINGWVKVKYSGKTGYVSKSYISSTEVKPDSNNGSNDQGNNGSQANSSTINKIVNDAYKYLGYRYIYGAASPSVGFDCSGLTYYLYKTHAGVTLNRNSAAQASNGYQVSRSNLKPGDLVFFATSGGSRISHVGIYVGNGEMIHASTPTKGVIKSSINSSYYTSRFVTARRIIN
ncbi:C40 family peptidase [Miniphocaeibacter massiliensis]|uniref:C40 family peptidase n=1 Tax=Miniphocaeibacter massiliensis TaxID=2041841 RepID=UPI000C068F79|nr:C40 family peptidase [Miniphocaeibacter massiliensis]